MTTFDDSKVRIFSARDRDGDRLEVFRPTVRPDGAVALLRITPAMVDGLPSRVWWLDVDTAPGLRKALDGLLADDEPANDPGPNPFTERVRRIADDVNRTCTDIAEAGDDVDAEVVLRLLARTTASLGDLLAALAGEP